MATWRSEWAALDRGRERAAFYRAWHAAYRAGFPHGKTMRVLGPQPASVQEAVAAIGAGSARGEALTDIVRRAPEAFDAFEAGILEAGEAAGALEGALRLLAEHFTAQDRLMQRVRRQMAYPMSTAVAACVIAPLPLLVFGSPLAYALVAGGAVSVLFLQGGAFVRRVADRFASRPPRPLVRFTRALATALAAGLPLDRAATLAAGASGDAALVAHVARVGVRRLATASLSETLRGAPGLTRDFFAMLAVAEVSGNLDGSLGKLAALLDDAFP
ncbi:MAG: type II secretion system F family protein [Gemmatimonadota bacterium]